MPPERSRSLTIGTLHRWQEYEPKPFADDDVEIKVREGREMLSTCTYGSEY